MKNAGVTLTVVQKPKSQIVTKAISVVLIAVGVVAVAAVARQWFRPGEVYVPSEPVDGARHLQAIRRGMRRTRIGMVAIAMLSVVVAVAVPGYQTWLIIFGRLSPGRRSAS